MQIRKIALKDNQEVATLIRGILEDMGVPKIGTAYGDKNLDTMFETYQKPRSVYYIITSKEEIAACGGIAPLESYSGNVCELQKMYVSNTHRRKGLASKILSTCLETAKDLGFTGCYLETMPFMEAAQGLYKKYGFEYIQEPLGDTGHSACSVRMFKKFS